MNDLHRQFQLRFRWAGASELEFFSILDLKSFLWPISFLSLLQHFPAWFSLTLWQVTLPPWASLNPISELFFCCSVMSRFIFHWLAPNVNILLLAFPLRCTWQSAARHVCSKRKEHKEGLWLLCAKTGTSFLNGDLPLPVKIVTMLSPSPQPLLGLSPSLPVPVPWF